MRPSKYAFLLLSRSLPSPLARLPLLLLRPRVPPPRFRFSSVRLGVFIIIILIIIIIIIVVVVIFFLVPVIFCISNRSWKAAERGC